MLKKLRFLYHKIGQPVGYCLAGVFLSISLAQAAELRIEADKLMLETTQAAIWSPTSDSVWVVVRDTTLSLPPAEDWQRLGIQGITPLEVRGGQGVKIQARRPVAVNWPAAKQQPFMVLADQWVGINQRWQPTDRLAVSDNTGQRYQILPLDQQVASAPIRQQKNIAASGYGLVWPVETAMASSISSAVVSSTEATPVVAGAPSLSPTAESSSAVTEVYQPGTVVSITLPSQAQLASSEDTALTQRRRQFAAALGLLEEGLLQTQTATAEIPTTLPPEKRQPEAASAQEPRPAISRSAMLLLPISRLHPQIDEETPFHIALHKVQAALLATAPDSDDYLDKKLNLVRLYIAYQRPLDAIGILKTLTPDGRPPADTRARLMLAVAYLLNEQPMAAQAVLPTTPEDLTDHVAMWAGIAAIQQQNFAAGYADMADNMAVTALYPLYVQLRIRLYEVQALFALKKYSLLAERLAALKELNGDKLPFAGQFLLAQAQLAQGRVVEGRRLLSRLAAEAPAPIAVEAKFLFLQDLLRTAELGIPQYLRLMEQLRFEWRGDGLEGQMLLALGDAYRSEKDYRNALNRYKTFAVVFPEAEENDRVLSIMRNTFLDIFEPENRLKLDRLAMLGSYYDYRELTPADKRGDRVIVDMANLLENLTLFQRAARLMERQLNFRIEDDAEKARLGIALAGMYRKQNLITQASAALEEWAPRSAVPEDIARDYAMEKAQILKEQGEFYQARQLLENWLDDRAQHLLANIAWQQEDYVTVTRILVRIFDTNEHAGFEDAEIQTQFMRLTHALGLLRQKRALATLVDNYREKLRSFPDLAAQINIAMAQQGIEPLIAVPEANHLQQIAQTFDLLEDFESAYNSEQERIGDIIYERELYNDKMRYMEFMQEQGLL